MSDSPQDTLRYLALTNDSEWHDACLAGADALDEVNRLRAENASIEEMNESLRNQNLSLIATNEKNEAENEQLKQRVAELEAETERLCKWDLKQRELYDIQAQQNADHYKQRIAELEVEFLQKDKETES